MPLALTLFPDIDGLDGLIESTMPLFAFVLFALGAAIVGVLAHDCVDRIRHRSPVDKLLRRRPG